jgi:type IV fimbrial biogenesis protein FimT
MKRSASSSNAGFTLIELMVTVTIGAILLLVAAPSFITYQRSSELTSAANTFVAGVNTARGEAMKRGMNAMLVPASGTDWSSGWTVFVDQDRSGGLNAGDTTVIQQSALPSYFSASGQGTASESPPYIMFDASGYAKTKAAGFGALTMTIARNDLSGAARTEQTRRVIIARSGRARTCKPATDNTCTTAAEE